ncbi:MAG TPA: stage II sporulation protein M [archaeon]|nr:stage II sporulation protein M [archaeon]
MVLESVFPKKLIKNRAFYALFLGWLYSIVGIAIAKLVFPADPSLVAVGITSILLIPSLQKIYYRENKVLTSTKYFSWKRLYVFNKDAIKIYLGLFVGIFIIYLTAATILPSLQVNTLFKTQLDVRGAATGMAAGDPFDPLLMMSILGNNWWVLIATFMISLLIADGGIFMITWNASVWGTIFGVTARNAGFAAQINPVVYVLIIIAIVTPHMILEMLSYILGAIAGGSLSKDLALGGKKIEVVTTYCVLLFFVAMIVMVLGAFVETYVLVNADIYRDIIRQSLAVGFAPI